MTSSSALLITQDELLLDDLLRLAAAAGTTLDVAHDTTNALRAWSSASVVLVGADQVDALAVHRPSRRDQVHVVAHGPVGDAVFRSALATGAVDVAELPAADDWLVELLTDAADGAAHPARTVGVVGGCGGSGATTFACAMALTAAAKESAVLIDLDPLGPGLDRVVGLDTDQRADHGVRWDALVGSRGRLGSRSLRAALPVKGGLAVLTWAPGPAVALDAGSVREVLSAAQRGHDTVVVDLPRAVDDVTAEVVSRCDEVLVVADPSVAGVASAGRVVARLRPLNRSLGLVVRDVGSTVPAQHVAGVLELPLVAQMPAQRRLAEHVDLGLGPVHSARSPLARASRSALGAHRRASGPVG